MKTADTQAVKELARATFDLVNTYQSEEVDAEGRLVMSLENFRDASRLVWAQIWLMEEQVVGFVDAIYVELERLGNERRSHLSAVTHSAVL